MYACGVAVVHQGHVVGEALYEPDLFGGQGGAAGGDDILYAVLVHHHHIYVALNEIAFLHTRHFRLGVVDSEQYVAFFVYFGVGGVDVFCVDVRAQGPAAERDNAAADGKNREHNPLAELVPERSVLVADCKSCIDEILFLIAGGNCSIDKRPASARGPAEVEALYGRVLEPAAAQVGIADIASLTALERGGEELHSELGYKEQAFTVLPLLDLLRAFLLFLNLDVVLFGKQAEGVGVFAMLHFHHESYRSAGFSAAEALVDSLGWGYVKRRGLFVVERAAGDKAGSTTLQAHIVSDHVGYLGCVEYLVNCLLRYHNLQKYSL